MVPCLGRQMLRVGDSINLTVFYSPDFSASRISQQLTIACSIGIVTVPLEAVVSPQVLSVCHFATPEGSVFVCLGF